MQKINKQNLMIILAIILATLFIFFAISYTKKPSSENVNNVSVIDGKQIIEIKAKGGYLPIYSVAKAGLPTILRINTDGTFDCSSSIRIPSMDISRNLPMSGTTDIDIGIQSVGIFHGTCGMGMYPFEIDFQI